MEKYLFNDGTNVIREVQSREELEKYIQSAANPGAVKIWVYHTSEWISPAEWRKRYALAIIPASKKKQLVAEKDVAPSPVPVSPVRWIKPVLLIALITAATVVVYNLTRVKWTAVAPISVTAARPENVPLLDVDSLIQTIEASRGKKLDKVTATNLRIRNTWPDRLLLSVTAKKDSSSRGNRYYDLELLLDNATGYQVDDVAIKLISWINGEVVREETVQFQKVGYAAPLRRKLDAEMKGDSVSLYFSAVKARAFNFCYDEQKKSNSGNYNDRWFCRD